MKTRSNISGSGLITVLAACAAVVIIALVGWVVYAQNHKNVITSTATKSGSQTTTKTPDPYAGWKTATSSRAGFTVKYPAGWTYNSTVGTKDGVEHITIVSSKMQVSIDSYSTQAGTTCADCLNVSKVTSLTAGKLGSINLSQATYTLDSGQANALILSQPNSTYYVPSPDASGVYTTFRAISVLDSETAYQAETATQFTANTDFANAEKVLESVSY